MNNQEAEELSILLDGSPEKFIEKVEQLGLDLNTTGKDIAKKLVKERFQLTDEQFDAVDYIYWIAFFVEREAEDLIISPEVGIGARESTMKLLVKELSFGSKITMIQELYSNKRDPFIKLMRVVQDLRNQVAHGKFDNLKYSGYHLSDYRGKLTLLMNLRDAALKK